MTGRRRADRRSDVVLVAEAYEGRRFREAVQLAAWWGDTAAKQVSNKNVAAAREAATHAAHFARISGATEEE